MKIAEGRRSLVVVWLYEIRPVPTMAAPSKGSTGTNQAYRYKASIDSIAYAYSKWFWRVGKNRLHFDTLNLTLYPPIGAKEYINFRNLINYEKYVLL